MDIEKDNVGSNWPKDLLPAIIFLSAGVIFTCIYSAFATYVYLREFVVDLPFPSDDIQYLISSIMQMTIPLVLIGLTLILIMRTRTAQRSTNILKCTFLGGTILVTIGGLVQVFVMNYYFRDQNWIENIDLVNHLSFLGTIFYHVGFAICGIAAIWIIRSTFVGDTVVLQAR